MPERAVFLTGGTGYMGGRLIPRLLARGHQVTAFVRPGSEGKVPAGARIRKGDPFDAASLGAALPGHDTWVQLIGTPHPGPAKTAQFQAIDLRAVRAMAEALSAPSSSAPGIRHAVYLSVAHPAPVMRSYIAVRSEGESRLRGTGVACSFLRPWYVLGPGHRWPYALIPFYKLLERIPATREGALRLGLVTLEQMLAALVRAIESDPPAEPRIVDVPAIRAALP